MTGKQLKNSILQWAIQGKLVPQDPNDEPASVLLDRIRAEKARLVKEKKIKKPKNESIIYRGDDNSHYEKFPDGTVRCIDDKIPFEIPESWVWCRVSTVSSCVIDGDHQAPPKTTSGIPFVVISDISQGQKEIKTTRFVPKEYFDALPVERKPIKGDILFSVTGSYGIAVENTFDSDFCFQRHIALLRPLIWSKWLYLVMQSSIIQTQCDDTATGMAQKTVGLESLRNFLMPLPPIAEQQKIVQRLQEIKPLLDKYSTEQIALESLNASVNETLKKSILQEAIQGRLVEQSEEDEPALALLQRIQAEKERLIKEKKIKRDKTESVIFRRDDNCYYEQLGKEVRCIQEEIPYEIPNSWEWARISTVLWLNPKNEADNSTFAAFIPMEKVGAGYGSSFDFDTVEWKHIRQGYTHFADGDVAFAKITPCFQNRKSAVFSDLPNGIGAGTTELRVLRPYADTFHRFFLLYFLQSPYFVDDATFKGTANQQRIVVGYLENKLIPIPPLEEQNRIVAKIEHLFQMLK